MFALAAATRLLKRPVFIHTQPTLHTTVRRIEPLTLHCGGGGGTLLDPVLYTWYRADTGMHFIQSAEGA
jgi:hypothetical protein